MMVDVAKCPLCDGTGDVHRADGEWMGECDCGSEFRHAYDVEANPSKAFRVIQSLTADRDFWKERFQVETRARIEAEAQLAELEAENERLREAISRTGAVKVTRTDILREWFGGERYARDYEYLDANYGRQADQVVAYLSAFEPHAPEGQQPVAWRYRFVTSIYGDLSDWFMVDDLSSIPPRNNQTIQPLFTLPSEQAVKEAHKLLLWAADSFEAHAKSADALDEIDGCFGSAEMYREVASALKAAMEAGG